MEYSRCGLSRTENKARITSLLAVFLLMQPRRLFTFRWYGHIAGSWSPYCSPELPGPSLQSYFPNSWAPRWTGVVLCVSLHEVSVYPILCLVDVHLNGSIPIWYATITPPGFVSSVNFLRMHFWPIAINEGHIINPWGRPLVTGPQLNLVTNLSHSFQATSLSIYIIQLIYLI